MNIKTIKQFRKFLVDQEINLLKNQQEIYSINGDLEKYHKEIYLRSEKAIRFLKDLLTDNINLKGGF